MSPLLDQALVALLVTGSLGYLVHVLYKKRKGCAGGCCPVSKNGFPRQGK